VVPEVWQTIFTPVVVGPPIERSTYGIPNVLVWVAPALGRIWGYALGVQCAASPFQS
jgi:hypothetical protein